MHDPITREDNFPSVTDFTIKHYLIQSNVFNLKFKHRFIKKGFEGIYSKSFRDTKKFKTNTKNIYKKF